MKSWLYYNFRTGIEKSKGLFSWWAIIAMLVVAVILATWLIFSGELERLLG